MLTTEDKEILEGLGAVFEILERHDYFYKLKKEEKQFIILGAEKDDDPQPYVLYVNDTPHFCVDSMHESLPATLKRMQEIL